MKKLGISVYVGHAPLEDNLNYIKKAASYGFKRIFSCLLSVDPAKKNEIIHEFKEVISLANTYGMEVILDISPKVFNDFNISYNDLTFFAELGAFGIRLDQGYSGNEESLMTFNPQNLVIEINMSNDTSYLDTIMQYHPNKEKLWGCHNFYPHRYTAMPRNYFLACSERFKKYNIRTAAFVNSPSAHFGPWEVNEGLCSLEEHRDKSIRFQAQDLFATGLIDDVIISNCFASDEELKELSEINPNLLTLKAVLVNGISVAEKSIVLDELHFNRGDINDYMIRSTQSRDKYKGNEFKIFNAPPILKKGDIVIESSLYAHYAGELHLVKQDMPNSGKSNVVGRLIEDDIALLANIKPWQKFKISL